MKHKIRRLKHAYWSGGTQGYAAPEVTNWDRYNRNITPFAFPTPRSDIFSLGCVILNFLRIPQFRYNEQAWNLLEFTEIYSYEYYPYSKPLVDLALKCIHPDARQRPSSRSLFKETRNYAAQSYEDVQSHATSSGPNNAYEGQVIWNKETKKRFKRNYPFREAYIKKNDWFTKNRPAVRKLYLVAKAPGREAVLPPGYVALGNGLGVPYPLLEKDEHLHGELEVYNTEGQRIRPKDGRPLLHHANPLSIKTKLPGIATGSRSGRIHRPRKKSGQPREPKDRREP